MDNNIEGRRDTPDEGAGPGEGAEPQDGAGRDAARSSRSREPPRQAEDGGWPVSQLCRLCGEEREEGRLFAPPCRCRSTFVHRFCLQERVNRGQEECPWCRELYPVRIHRKPTWKWFWGKETRALAFLFVTNMFFTVGDVGVLSMAWMYVLFEFPSTPWLPAAALASTLFVFSVMWVAFGCARFHLLRMPLDEWKIANTTREVVLVGDRAEPA